MKEIKKIGISQFCKEYTNRVPQMQETYIKENLVITPYISFVRKDALAGVIMKRSTYKYENYKKEDGTVDSRPTDKIKVNSVAQYILFCRVVIENYTNLKVETEGFFEEYDALKQSGLLDKLMVGTETTTPLIPQSEIAELRAIIDMKSRDAMTNYATPQTYISNQIERFGTLFSITLKPVLDKIATSIENMDEKDIEKIGNKLEKMLKRVK